MGAELVELHECVVYGDRCRAGGAERGLDSGALLKEVEAELVRYLVDYGAVLVSYAEIYDLTSDVVKERCGCSRVRGLKRLLYKRVIPGLRLHLIRSGRDPEDVLYLYLPRNLAERGSAGMEGRGTLLRRALARIRFTVDKWMRHVFGSDDLELFDGNLKIVSRVKWGLLEELAAAILYDAYSSSNEVYERTPKDWYFGMLAEAHRADEVREFLRPDGTYTAFRFGSTWVLKRKYACNSPLGYCYGYRRVEAEDLKLEGWL